MSGIEKEIDHLGRVVIPIKFRRKLGLEENPKVTLSLDEDAILISPANKHCVLCGKATDIHQKFRLCKDCILKIKSE